MVTNRAAVAAATAAHLRVAVRGRLVHTQRLAEELHHVEDLLFGMEADRKTCGPPDSIAQCAAWPNSLRTVAALHSARAPVKRAQKWVRTGRGCSAA